MRFTPEQRYKGGMAAKAKAEEFQRETGKNGYAHTSKGREAGSFEGQDRTGRRCRSCGKYRKGQG